MARKISEFTKVSSYTLNTGDVFEHLVKEDDFELNHVVIKPGFKFPAHPTDAAVIITVVKGSLYVQLGDYEPMTFEKGKVVQVEEGIVSVLGNEGAGPCELFVVKRRQIL